MTNSTKKGKPFSSLGEEEYYWLGFLFGDGYVVDMKTQQAQIGLTLKDRLHVERFRSFLGVDNKISEKNVNGSQAFRLHIYDDEVKDALAEYGIVQDKTLTATPSPELCQTRHFWRGYIDADGTMDMAKNCPRFRIKGGRDALILLKNFLKPKSNAAVRETQSKACSFGIHANEVARLMSRLYVPSVIALPRKKSVVTKQFLPHINPDNQTDFYDELCT